jgi:hypothetical protein
MTGEETQLRDISSLKSFLRPLRGTVSRIIMGFQLILVGSKDGGSLRAESLIWQLFVPLKSGRQQ